MSHTEKTPNYSLPLFADDDTPTWLGDWNQGMRSVDDALNTFKGSIADSSNQVANLTTRVTQNEASVKAMESTVESHTTQITQVQIEANNAYTLAQTNEGDIAEAEKRITKNEQGLAALPAQIANAQQTADNASSEASAARRSADTVAAKFPIRTSSIQSGAVTADKLDETSVHRLLTSFTYHRFDSTDPKADNTGMTCPENYTLKGWYVEELQLLVIEDLSSTVKFESVITTPVVILPSYVPTPTENITISACGIIMWSSSRPFIDWSGVAITTSRGIGPKSTMAAGEGEKTSSSGTLVGIVRKSSTAAASADAYAAANGMVAR